MKELICQILCEQNMFVQFLSQGGTRPVMPSARFLFRQSVRLPILAFRSGEDVPALLEPIETNRYLVEQRQQYHHQCLHWGRVEMIGRPASHRRVSDNRSELWFTSLPVAVSAKILWLRVTVRALPAPVTSLGLALGLVGTDGQYNRRLQG